MQATYAIGAALAATGVGISIAAIHIATWRRANRPARPLAIGAVPDGLTDLDRQRNADYPIYAELYSKAGYAIGTSRAAILVAAHEAGLINERYDPKAPWDNVRETGYLDACAQVLYFDPDAVTEAEYHGLDPDSVDDADAWVAALERAGHSVIRGQVALDRAYTRMINEEFAAFDRATTEAYNRVRAVGSREIIDWANDWKRYAEEHAIEAATVEIKGIREWIDNELAADTAASIMAEMNEADIDLLADAPH